jgi:hypothetical protein
MNTLLLSYAIASTIALIVLIVINKKKDTRDNAILDRRKESLQDAELSSDEKIDILKDVIAYHTLRIDSLTKSQMNFKHRLDDIETQRINQENGNTEENN